MKEPKCLMCGKPGVIDPHYRVCAPCDETLQDKYVPGKTLASNQKTDKGSVGFHRDQRKR